MTQIITVPNPILRKKSKPVSPPIGGNQSLITLIKTLKKTLSEAEEPKGVGLSAVQIGQPLRIFLARKTPEDQPIVFINPKITWQSKQLTDGVPPVKATRNTRHATRDTQHETRRPEGCLSVPGYYGLVKRHKKIKLKYITLTKDQRSKTRDQVFSGFLTTVIQHEIDHLDGILFIDRVLKQGGKLYKVEENKLVETRL